MQLPRRCQGSTGVSCLLLKKFLTAFPFSGAPMLRPFKGEVPRGGCPGQRVSRIFWKRVRGASGQASPAPPPLKIEPLGHSHRPPPISRRVTLSLSRQSPTCWDVVPWHMTTHGAEEGCPRLQGGWTRAEEVRLPPGGLQGAETTKGGGLTRPRRTDNGRCSRAARRARNGPPCQGGGVASRGFGCGPADAGAPRAEGEGRAWPRRWPRSEGPAGLRLQDARQPPGRGCGGERPGPLTTPPCPGVRTDLQGAFCPHATLSSSH